MFINERILLKFYKYISFNVFDLLSKFQIKKITNKEVTAVFNKFVKLLKKT